MADQLTEGLIDPPRRKRPMPPPVGGGFSPEAPGAPQQPDPMQQAAKRLQDQAESNRQLAMHPPAPAKGLRAGLGTAATIVGSLVNPQIGQMLNQKLLHPGRERWQQQMDRAEDIQKINAGELSGLERLARVQDLHQNRMDVNADRDAARTDSQRSAAIAEDGRLRGQGAEDLPADIQGRMKRRLLTPGTPDVQNLPQKVTRYAPGLTGEQQVSPDVGTVKTVEGGGYQGKLVLPTAGEKQRRKSAALESELSLRRKSAQFGQPKVTDALAKKYPELGLVVGDPMEPSVYNKLIDPLTTPKPAPVAGRDIPLPKDVEEQRKRMNAQRAMQNGLSPNQTNQAQSLASKFGSEPIVKDFNIIAGKLENVRGILDAKLGGPGDLAVVYEFMKGLDPGSVVRESEFDAAAKSGNIFTGALARFNGYLSPQGGFLPPQVKDAFLKIVEQKMRVSKAQTKRLYDDYARRIDPATKQTGTGRDYLTDYTELLSSGGDRQSVAPGVAIRYQSDGLTFNIPAAEEAEFLKDHPKAVKVQNGR